LTERLISIAEVEPIVRAYFDNRDRVEAAVAKAT